MKKYIAMLLAALLLCTAGMAEADTAMLQAYRDTLENLSENYCWPDGEAAVEPETQNPVDFAENLFAVADIDGDGADELIVMITSGIMADMQARIYQYRDGEMALELVEFPWLECYDNGVILAYASHNHTESEFWPYTLLRYDAETDTYAETDMVYAADLEMAQDGFLTFADADGDGRVFYICAPGAYGETEPCDNAEYEAWLGDILNGAAQIESEWFTLTAENIAALAAE